MKDLAERIATETFRTTRLREGYNIDDVDDFLDEVISQLNELGNDNIDYYKRTVVRLRQMIRNTKRDNKVLKRCLHKKYSKM